MTPKTHLDVVRYLSIVRHMELHFFLDERQCF